MRFLAIVRARILYCGYKNQDSSSNILLDDQQEKQRNDSKCENNGQIR